MEIGQTRGASTKVGDKKMFEFQNGMGIRGRKWKQINPHVQDPLKERSGPQLKGVAAQGSGQIQGASEGPSTVRLGEKSVRPIGSISHITLRAASKGRIDEKTGMANPSCEEAQERERSAVEDRDFQETNSRKDHGSRKSNDIKQVTSRKESHPIMDKARSKEEDEGRYYSTPGKKSITGKSLEKTLSVGVEGGCHLAVVDSKGSVLMDFIQKGGKVKCSSRISETSPVDTRLGDEGDDDTRAGRRVIVGDTGLGHFDGTWAEFSGRVRHDHHKVQEETKSDSGNFFGVDRWSGPKWAPGRDLGRPKVSPPVLGLVYRAALCPVSSTQALLNGLHFHEPICSKPKETVLEPGQCQNLPSKSLVNSASLATIFGSPKEGQEGNAINMGEGAEFREVADQEDGYNPMNSHGLGPGCLSSSRSKEFSQDKARTPSFLHKDRAKDPLLFSDEERYCPPMPLYSSTSSPYLDRTPHLVESFGHRGPDETPQAS